MGKSKSQLQNASSLVHVICLLQEAEGIYFLSHSVIRIGSILLFFFKKYENISGSI